MSGTISDAKLYLCTDARVAQGDFQNFCKKVFAGGVDIIQLRDKSIDAAAELRVLETLAEIADSYDALWAVNDRADIARISGAPILHIGQDDLSAMQAREIVGDGVFIGRSSHAMGECVGENEDSRVDYFAVGPCWPTPTKPGRAAPGLDLVRQVGAFDTTKPWFAIGGIDLARVPEVLAAGATRIVVVRAITEAPDPEAAASALRKLL
jgi:thiamine-phosphate pyrophosphorylase